MDEYTDGETLAAIVAGAWRLNPAPLQISVESLVHILPKIQRGGSSGLAWWKVRNSGLALTPPGVEIRDVFRTHTIRARVQEHDLQIVLRRLRKEGIEPLLAKGWAMARYYPAPGVRPYGDFDICVSAKDYGKTDEILAESGMPGPVDLHNGFRELPTSYDELLSRSDRVPLGETYVQVLGCEEHLRLLILHTFSHGAWKPLWLCDIALFLESAALEPRFDWKLCLTDDRWTSEWVVAGIALAHHVLGARLPPPVAAIADQPLPAWLTSSLLKQWGRSFDHYMRGPTAAELIRKGRLKDLLQWRWPEPIEATVRRHGRLNKMPRLPFQVAEAISRTARVVLKNL